MIPCHALPLLLVALVSSCTSVAPKLDLPSPVVINDVRVEVTCVLSHYGRGGLSGFSGTATNTSGEALSYCIVTLELLDPSGAKIGDAMATTTHLAAGQTWRFDAHNANTITSSVERVRVAQVQTDKSLVAGIARQRATGGAARAPKPEVATSVSETQPVTSSSADEQADRVERAILRVGETRPVAGAATEPFPFTVQLAREKSDGTFEASFQEVAFVHTVAGNLKDGLALYRVGLVGGQPRIVMRGKMNSRRYEVLWESWQDGWRRAGSPVSQWIDFDH
ncbi:MAG: FxLYD domain-containing protein [Planctomycetes bacterium]|nr:FxLYD domain-containing protein [Planctomycetota bacterium]